MATLQIFLVDDHMVVREGLKTLINAQPDMEVIGEAGDGETAWQQARDCQPDVVIMDISMPHMNGIHLLSFAPQIDGALDAGAPVVLATSTPDGQPDIALKGSFLVWGGIGRQTEQSLNFIEILRWP